MTILAILRATRTAIKQTDTRLALLGTLDPVAIAAHNTIPVQALGAVVDLARFADTVI